jgi:hypothetical protein
VYCQPGRRQEGSTCRNTSLRCRAIEENAYDAIVLAEETRKIVGLDRVALDARIEAPGASARMHHIPERDPRAAQRA